MGLRLFLMALTFVIINVNGLHDQTKWPVFWQEVMCADIICVQESHLTASQENSFRLYAQSYDFFFSHRISQSAGVWVAVRQNIGIMAVKSSEV